MTSYIVLWILKTILGGFGGSTSTISWAFFFFFFFFGTGAPCTPFSCEVVHAGLGSREGKILQSSISSVGCFKLEWSREGPSGSAEFCYLTFAIIFWLRSCTLGDLLTSSTSIYSEFNPCGPSPSPSSPLALNHYVTFLSLLFCPFCYVFLAFLDLDWAVGCKGSGGREAGAGVWLNCEIMFY